MASDCAQYPGDNKMFKVIAAVAVLLVSASSASAVTTSICGSAVPNNTIDQAYAIIPFTNDTQGRMVSDCVGLSDTIDYFSLDATEMFNVHITALSSSNAAYYGINVSLYDASKTKVDTVEAINAPTSDLFGDLARGLYYFSVDLDYINSGTNGVVPEVLYTLKVKPFPSPVPLPAGLPLLLVGLGGIALLRTRR